jgi:transcriptional regulator with XRE-family HTH domain
MSIVSTKLEDTYFTKVVRLLFVNEKIELASWLTSMMEKDNMGVREAARKIGVSHPTVSDILEGFQPSYATCQKVATAYKVPLTLVLQMANLLVQENLADDRKQEIDFIYDKLNDEGRDELLEQGRLRLRIQEEQGGRKPRTKTDPQPAQ